MSELDIRHKKTVPTVIRFSDDFSSDTTLASTLKRNNRAHNRVEICDKDYDYDGGVGYLIITNKEHAELLKLALDKAIELGWRD